MTIPPDQIPLRDSKINLDISGVAGFFGGDVAISAMATLHVYRARKWLGWYNSPGSFEIAKRYGQIVRSRLWAGLYPGIQQEPAVLFELDGRVGPSYCRAAFWDNRLEKTGHLAYLFFEHCRQIPVTRMPLSRSTEFGARIIRPIAVIIAELNMPQRSDAYQSLWKSTTPDLKAPNTLSFAILSVFPISASIATLLACALAKEWLVASMIALGMLANGLSCLAIGWGKLVFPQYTPSIGEPLENGILDDDSQIVIVRGAFPTVNTIINGRFTLLYGDRTATAIGWSSILLTGQFVAQLLVVPQGNIFGQVMFLCSLAVSWGYNTYLSSIDRMSLQRQILVEKFLRQPKMHKIILGTRPSMVVFVLLVMSGFAQSDKRWPNESATFQAMLDRFIPSPQNSHVWQTWKNAIITTLVRNTSRDSESSDVPPFEPEPGYDPGQESQRHQGDIKLLSVLYQDAETARQVYLTYCKMRRSDGGTTDAA